MKTRNPKATCGNCPYFCKGQCRVFSPTFHIKCQYGNFPSVYPNDWCGEHPDFWVEEEEAPHTDPEEWLPADNASRKWETVICDNGKEIYAGFRSRAVWYRLGFNGTYPCAAPQRWKPLQALAETDEEDDSWKYRTCRECKHRGSMCGCGRFYLGRTLEFIPDKNNCPLFKEGDPDEKEES